MQPRPVFDDRKGASVMTRAKPLRAMTQSAVTAVLALLLTAAPAVAGDLYVSHQGRLLDGLGDPLTGSASLRVSLYSDVEGTVHLWRSTFPSTGLEHGYFSLGLTGDDDTGRSLDDVLGSGPLYVGIAVDTTVDDGPAERLGSGLGAGGLPTGCALGAQLMMSANGWACTTGGSVLQEVSTTAGSGASGNWAYGTTTSSSGGQVMSLTITPTTATSTLEVVAITSVRENGNTSDVTGMGIYRNSESAPLVIAHNNGTYSNYSHGYSGSGKSHMEYLEWSGTSGTTSPITFKVRVGTNSTGIRCSPGLCTMTVRERL
jgi:hypothetical protein